MKSEFNYYFPTRILFGPGKLKQLSQTRLLPGKKALIVISAGTSMRKNGYLDRVQAYLKENGVESLVFDKVMPNPVAAHVMEGSLLAKTYGCDFVVGLGGGSSIDSAKSIAVMARNPGDYWDYIPTGSGKKMRAQSALPIVAIPTTSGTGSESDPWTVISKPETNEKIGWGTGFTFPVLSIVDPELTLTVPPRLTAFQGMDTFFHAVEGYLAKTNQPASDLYALEAVRLVSRYLPQAVKDGQNLEARSALAWASTEAGMVETLSSCISHHSLEHAISAFHPQLPHGAGLVMTSVAYFSHLSRLSPARFSDLAAAMRPDYERVEEEEISKVFIEALKQLIADIGLTNLKLEEFGVDRQEAKSIARNAVENMGSLFRFDPVELKEAEIATIFESCF